MRLKDRVAIVTGGSQGIGAAIAVRYAAEGAKLAIVYSRNDANANAVATAIRDAGGTAECIKADCSKISDIERMVASVIRVFGRVDILVNNAGAAWGAEFDEFPESGWDKVMNLNLKAPFFLTKALAAPLRAAATAEKPAKVINIASIDGFFVNPAETYSYAASKSGLIHLTRRMAVKLIRDHIVVSAIAPGPFKSDMNKAARDNADEVSKRVPSGRIGTDEDMAGAAIYLASRAGDYVVGATIAVDGGIVYANPGIKGDGWD